MAEKNYDIMSEEELLAELKEMEEALEDLEVTFNFNLAYANVHLPESMIVDHEQEIEEYREAIAALKRRLGIKS